MNKLEQYYRIGQAAGVQVELLGEDRVMIQACTVMASGNELQLDKKIIGLNLPGGLKEHLPAGALVALNLSGKGILQKRMERVEQVDLNTLNAIFPNAKPEDFYIQNFPSGEFSFISLVRRAEADKWLALLRDYSFRPLMLSLGPFPVDVVIPLLNIYEAEFPLNGYRIKRNEKAEWTECRADETAHAGYPMKLASESVDEKLVVPYAAAFQLVLGDRLEPVKAGADLLQTDLQELLSDRKIKVRSVVMLVILFVVLLVNFLVWSSLRSSNNDLAAQASNYAKNSSSQAELNEQVKSKEARLRSLGWDGGIDKSVLIDQIAALLPPGISMSEIAVDPVDRSPSRTNRQLAFEDQKIQVIGISDKVIPVNEWIARIKTRSWVKNARLENFAYNNELNTGQFTVTINY